MPFYEAIGRDAQSFQSRTIQISARNEQHAQLTASAQGIAEVKLRPYSDREMLMMDLKCFLNAEPAPAPSIPKNNSSASAVYRPSLLHDHPILIITSSVLLALMLNRIIDMLVTFV